METYERSYTNERRAGSATNSVGIDRSLDLRPWEKEWPHGDHIKRIYQLQHHYYESHPTINPSGVVRLGPILRLYDLHKPVSRRLAEVPERIKMTSHGSVGT